jgi:hypothetical protein
VGSPTFTFGSGMPLNPREVIVEQHVGKIDYFEVKTTTVVPGTPSLHYGAPADFRYGDSANPATFVGYVEGANDSLNSVARRNLMVLQGLGSTEVMRDRRSKSWTNRTIPEIVKEIANTYRFNLVIDRSTQRWKVLTQEDQTDWAFVRSLADRVGWWAFCLGTTIYVLNPTLLAGRQVPVVIDANTGRFNQSSQDQPYMGDARLLVLTGRWTDPATGKTHRFTPETYVPIAGEAPPRRINEEMVIHGASTYSEARLVFLGLEKKHAWYMERRLTIDGRTDLHPGRAIHLLTPRASGTRRAQGYEAYDGLWIIKGVQHRLAFGTSRDFVTELSLVRDGRGYPKRRLPIETPIAWDRQPPSRLIGDRWVSAWTAAA